MTLTLSLNNMQKLASEEKKASKKMKTGKTSDNKIGSLALLSFISNISVTLRAF